MIYPNLAAAKKAQTEFLEKLSKLEEEFGVKFEQDDSCSNVWWAVKYYDEKNMVQTLY